MKKIFALIICLACVFLLAACGEDKNKDNGDNSKNSDTDASLESLPENKSGRGVVDDIIDNSMWDDIFEGDKEDGIIDGREDAENGGKVDSGKNGMNDKNGNHTGVTDGGIMDGGIPGSPDYLP